MPVAKKPKTKAAKVRAPKAKTSRARAAKSASSATQYVLMPERGMRASPQAGTHDFLIRLSQGPLAGFSTADLGAVGMAGADVAAAVAATSNVRVVDSISENGAKLVEMSAEAKANLKILQPALRIVPVVYYDLQRLAPLSAESKPQLASASSATRNVTIKVTDQNGAAVAGARVVAFTDFANRIGRQGTTNANGTVTLQFPNSTSRFDMLLADRSVGFWGGFRRNVSVTPQLTLTIDAINLNFRDCVDHFVGAGNAQSGRNVRVGVVDTGVGPHADLRVAGGLNTVAGENPSNFGDNGHMHGTHVAGTIASVGVAPNGRPGIAPGVDLRSYRVFGQNAEKAASFAIAKAIDAAARDGCHLINLSLGGGSVDPLTQEAISDARAAGALCIIAAGNDDRSPVSFPASDPNAVAVSAVGREGTFPASALQAFRVVRPPKGANAKNFIASFSNVGSEIDLAGPGVGVISTVLGGYGVMDGTSMACPAVTGAAARLLAARPDILAMAGAQRSAEILKMLLLAAVDLGFAAEFQGKGVPK